MKIQKERNHERAQDQIGVSISMPKWLNERIKAHAKIANRTRSNWIVTQLQGAILEIEEAELARNSPPD